MDVIAALGPMAATAAEPEPPDARDPATAAAFSLLLAGLATPPAMHGAAATAPAGGGTPEREAPPGATGAAIAPSVGLQMARARTEVPSEGPGPAEVPDSRPATSAVQASPAVRATPAVPGSPAAPATPAVPATPAAPGAPAGAVPRAEAADHEPGTMRNDPAAPSAGTAADPRRARDLPASLPDVARGPDATDERARHTGRPSPSAAGDDAFSTVAVPASASTPLAITSEATTSDAEDERPAELSPEPAPVAGLDAPTRIAADAAVAATSDAGPFAGSRGIERALAAQLVERVGTLRHREDGDYELTIQLEPADLGRLELRVRLEGGVVHVQVGAESAATTDLVRRSLPDLREALVQAGLDPGRVDVGNQPDQRGGESTPRPDRDLRDGEASPPARAHVRSAPSVHPSARVGLRTGVDVLL